MFTFILTPEQTNLIGAALSKLPYEQVADLLINLRTQIAEQVGEQQPVSTKVEEEQT